MAEREWIFQVSCHTEPEETVCLTGSCFELGSWKTSNLIPLIPETSFTAGTAECEVIWKTSVKLPLNEVTYRYCICSTVLRSDDSEPEAVVYIVRKWETHLQPRMVPANQINKTDAVVDIFGISGGLPKVDQGWLMDENLIQFVLYKSQVYSDPVALWKKKHKDKKCFMKMTLIPMRSGNAESPFVCQMDESTEIELTELRNRSENGRPAVEVAVLKDGSEKFKPQSQFGVEIGDDCIVFQCRVERSKSIAFLADFYVEMIPGAVPQYIGCSFILPSTLKESICVASSHITSQKHIPIGQLTVHYKMVEPLKNLDCTMEVSYARYWKNSWKGLHVGHRGAGNSFHKLTKKSAAIRENTIGSLKLAAESGADMVEFDIQVSKDLVPVIYHDFHVYIALKRKKEPVEADLMWVPIKDLTIEQLQALKIYHKTEKGTSKFNDEDVEHYQPFPTLEKTLASIPETCGFILELKWTMDNADGTRELEDPFEANKYIDTILKVVFKSKTRRRIVFSCFNPDICTMLRMKQNRYPVLFLTQGDTGAQIYEDCRTRSIASAISFASSTRILGINPCTELVFRNPKALQDAFDRKLVVFVYGDENADRAVTNTLTQLGVHGIIYDKIDVYNSNPMKTSVLLSEDIDASNYCLQSHTGSGPGPGQAGSGGDLLDAYYKPGETGNRPTDFNGILSTLHRAENILVSS